MHTFLRRATIVSLVLLTLAAPLAPASAADKDPSSGTTTWMVRPSDGTGEDGRSWVDRTLDPGQAVTDYLLVRNLSPFAATFRLSSADGYFTQTGRFNMLTSGQKSVDAGTWVTIPKTVRVASGADAIVAYTITAPADATPGDHLAGVAASVRSGADDEVGIESRVGFRVMLRVTGELKPRVAVTVDASYVGSWNPFEPGRLDLTYTVTNTGNTRLAVAPRVRGGGPLGAGGFRTAGDVIAEIAPGESRTATTSVPAAWPLIRYTADLTAEASSVDGELPVGAVRPAAASVSAVAVPWAQLVTVAAAAALVLLVRHDRRRRRKSLAALIEQARREGREEAG